VGSFCIGVLYAFTLQHQGFTAGWRLFLITGFCGGFTTFSAFAIENVLLLQQGHYWSFAIYSAASFIFCLLAVVSGLYIVRVMM
jgi:CrcB protein